MSSKDKVYAKREVQAESFWATMKAEFYDRYLWPTKAVAKLAVGDWIERVYNRADATPLSV